MSILRSIENTQRKVHHVEFLNVKTWWYIKKPLGLKMLKDTVQTFQTIKDMKTSEWGIPRERTVYTFVLG